MGNGRQARGIVIGRPNPIDSNPSLSSGTHPNIQAGPLSYMAV